MIDIHTHILPGLDDGAEDIYDTLEMARTAADIGVTTIVATPHCNIPGLFDNYFGRGYVEVFQKAVKAIRQEGIPVELLPGMEVFATYDLPDLIVDGKIMPLNQSRYFLIEFAFDEDPDYAAHILEKVCSIGAKPVVAHAERYDFIQKEPRIADYWRNMGYVIQVNKGSFMGRFGGHARTAAFDMMQNDIVSVVASDAHSPVRRTTYMLDAYEELCGRYPKEKVDTLFRDNPGRICEDQPVLVF